MISAGKIPLSRNPGSMGQDIERSTPTEVDALTGYIIYRFKTAEIGVSVPMHEARSMV